MRSPSSSRQRRSTAFPGRPAPGRESRGLGDVRLQFQSSSSELEGVLRIVQERDSRSLPACPVVARVEFQRVPMLLEGTVNVRFANSEMSEALTCMLTFYELRGRNSDGHPVERLKSVNTQTLILPFIPVAVIAVTIVEQRLRYHCHNFGPRCGWSGVFVDFRVVLAVVPMSDR